MCGWAEGVEVERDHSTTWSWVEGWAAFGLGRARREEMVERSVEGEEKYQVEWAKRM